MRRELAVLETEQSLKRRREPKDQVDEIQFECGERSASGKILQARVVRHQRVFELLSIADVVLHADDAFEHTFRIDHLYAHALHPNPVSAMMSHPEFHAERARS